MKKKEIPPKEQSDYEKSKPDEASKDETPAPEQLIDEDSILRTNKRQILEENKNPKELPDQ